MSFPKYETAVKGLESQNFGEALFLHIGVIAMFLALFALLYLFMGTSTQTRKKDKNALVTVIGAIGVTALCGCFYLNAQTNTNQQTQAWLQKTYNVKVNAEAAHSLIKGNTETLPDGTKIVLHEATDGLLYVKKFDANTHDSDDGKKVLLKIVIDD